MLIRLICHLAGLTLIFLAVSNIRCVLVYFKDPEHQLSHEALQAVAIISAVALIPMVILAVTFLWNRHLFISGEKVLFLFELSLVPIIALLAFSFAR